MTKIVDSESFIFTFEDETLRSLDKDWTIQAGEGLAMESEADLSSAPLPRVSYKGRELNVCSIKYHRGCKRVQLARFLSGKIVFQPDKVTRAELLVMYDNFVHLQDLVEKNGNLREKFGEDLESLAKILKGFRVSSKTSAVNVSKLGSQMKEKLIRFILPERNLRDQEARITKFYSVQIVKPAGTLNSELPPKKHIAQGYTDQGTARDPAFDNSPSWQEVAMSNPEENGE